MGKKSSSKGKRGERELAKVLSKIFGVSARRGRQFSGSPDSPDVVAFKGIHIECKRVESFHLYASLNQAISDAGSYKVPVVMHRKNREEWVVVIRLKDLPKFIKRMISYV